MADMKKFNIPTKKEPVVPKTSGKLPAGAYIGAVADPEEFIKGADKREIDTILGECFTYGGLYDDDIMEDVHTYAELMHYIKTGSPT